MDYLALASNPETVEKVEGCMKVWIKQTEQVIPRNPWLVSDATSLVAVGESSTLAFSLSTYHSTVASVCLFV